MVTIDKRSDYGFAQICRREMGFSHPRSFSRRISASEVLVKRLDLYGKLNGHQGCVNTIQFNSSGTLLVSGSDDQNVIFWDWAAKSLALSYPSGHLDNIFQVKIMPFTDDRKVVTSSADGQVRLGVVLENGEVETTRLGKHHGRVHNLAVEPGSPYVVYSCGEDGCVKHFDLRSNTGQELFYCTSFTDGKQSSRNIRLNAMAIDPRNPNYFALGGSDEYARVYDIRKYHFDASSSFGAPVNIFCPHHLIESHDAHITSLAYSNKSELLVSYNDELIYLFQKSMGIGASPLSVSQEDLQNLEQPQAYSGHRNSQTVKGVNFFGPSDEYVMSGSDCGHIFIWKKKGASLVRVMVGDRHIVNQLESHPHLPIIATSGLEKNIKLWAPLSTDVLPLPDDVQQIMESNKRGREGHSRVSFNPDVLMHVLRMHRRQALAYVEDRHNRDDVESDEEDQASYVLGFAADDGDPRECNVS